MTDLTTSIQHFASLNRAPGPTRTDATKRKAPHKPLLLLALLDLVHRGVITSPFIAVTGDLVELNELFNLYWRRIIPLGQTSSIAFPFSRLSREPFWELVPLTGKTISAAVINNTASVSSLGGKRDRFIFQYKRRPIGRLCRFVMGKDLLTRLPLHSLALSLSWPWGNPGVGLDIRTFEVPGTLTIAAS